MQESESRLSEFIFYSSCSKVTIYRIFLQGITHSLYLQNNLQVVSPSLQSWILASTQSPPQFSPSHEHHSWETARILHKGDERLTVLREINKSRLPGQQDSLTQAVQQSVKEWRFVSSLSRLMMNRFSQVCQEEGGDPGRPQASSRGIHVKLALTSIALGYSAHPHTNNLQGELKAKVRRLSNLESFRV